MKKLIPIQSSPLDFTEDLELEPNRVRYLHNLISLLIFDTELQQTYATPLRRHLHELCAHLKKVSVKDPAPTVYKSDGFIQLKQTISALHRDIERKELDSDASNTLSLMGVKDLIQLVANPPRSTPNQPVDLLGLAEQVVAPRRKARPDLTFEIDTAEIDPTAFYTINYQFVLDTLHNYLSNATTHAKTSVVIKFKISEDQLLISVHDDGEPILDSDKLFKKPQTLGTQSGSGVGLFTLQETAGTLGIKLGYTDVPDKQFSLQTPVVSTKQVPNIESLSDTVSKPVIIYVDDNAMVRMIIENIIFKPRKEKCDYVIVPSTTRATRLMTQFLSEGRYLAGVYSDTQIDEATSPNGMDFLQTVKVKSPQVRRRVTSSSPPKKAERRTSVDYLHPTDHPKIGSNIDKLLGQLPTFDLGDEAAPLQSGGQ